MLIVYDVSGFYTAWLLPAAIVGLTVFLYGLFTLGRDSLSIIRSERYNV